MRTPTRTPISAEGIGRRYPARLRAAARAALLAVGLAAGAASAARAQSLPRGSPEALGFSPERLARIDTTVGAYVAQNRLAGAVTLVARDGRVVQLGAYGHRDRESRDPMKTDAIFRIASMSKAVTTVAALVLMEEGKLLLSDPVAKYIPAFAKTTVLATPREGAAAKEEPLETVPAKRPITIHDLMTQTAGISYGGGRAREQYEAAGTHLWYLADQAVPLGSFVDRIARLPFESQPGEKWVYGFSTDVLGRVVEVVSGMPLDAFLRTRIFEPLKMPDTSFFLPREKRGRLATVYAATESGGIERAPEHGREGQGEYVEGPRACFSGGAGLLSTAGDYARFLQMLANGGTMDGVRVLSPRTVALATTNHVGFLFDEGRAGFGLGFRVIDDVGRSGRPGAPGEYSWGSAYYGGYWVDPKERLVFLILAQLLPPRDVDLQDKFHVLVESAIIGPVARGASPSTSTSRSTRRAHAPPGKSPLP